MRRLLAVLLAAACVIPSASADSSATPGIELVAKLYRQFAWEALMNDPGKAVDFLDQPKAVLESYFEPKLAALILADRACAAATKEICKLDFAPLWASQDPSATDLRVVAGSRPESVRVEFRHPGDDQQTVLIFELSPSSAGLRIKDIQYEEIPSLRGLLEAK